MLCYARQRFHGSAVALESPVLEVQCAIGQFVDDARVARSQQQRDAIALSAGKNSHERKRRSDVGVAAIDIVDECEVPLLSACRGTLRVNAIIEVTHAAAAGPVAIPNMFNETVVRCEQARGATKQRGFPGASRSNESHDLFGLDVQTYLLQRAHICRASRNARPIRLSKRSYHEY